MTHKLSGALTVQELLDALESFKREHGGDHPVMVEGCDCAGWATSVELCVKPWSRQEITERGDYVEVKIDKHAYVRRDDSIVRASPVREKG